MMMGAFFVVVICYVFGNMAYMFFWSGLFKRRSCSSAEGSGFNVALKKLLVIKTRKNLGNTYICINQIKICIR